MKQKIVNGAAAIMIFGSLIYVAGKYGAYECGVIDSVQFITQAGIGIAVLAVGTILSNIEVKE